MPKNNIRYGLSSFKTIRENSFRYIDKTEQIFNLISEKNRCFFLTRSRRFGKTLLVDTLAEIFQGNKKLFRGLADLLAKNIKLGGIKVKLPDDRRVYFFI